MSGSGDESIYRAIVASSSEGVLVVDAQGVIMLVNPALERLFAYPEAALLGQRMELLVPEDRRHVHALHCEVYTERPERRPMGSGLRLFGRRSDGTAFPIDVGLTPTTLHGQPVTIATVRDLSALRSAQDALRRALAEAPPPEAAPPNQLPPSAAGGMSP